MLFDFFYGYNNILPEKLMEKALNKQGHTPASRSMSLYSYVEYLVVIPYPFLQIQILPLLCP